VPEDRILLNAVQRKKPAGVGQGNGGMPEPVKTRPPCAPVVKEKIVKKGPPCRGHGIAALFHRERKGQQRHINAVVQAAHESVVAVPSELPEFPIVQYLRDRGVL